MRVADADASGRIVAARSMSVARELTVFCRAGLSNRLRLLVSAYALAEVAGRSFRMVWPRTRRCGAAFSELFTNDWPVSDVDHLDPSLAPNQVAKWSPRHGHR